jgi:hypothetical protein
LVSRRELEAALKKAPEVMEILVAYDLAGTLRVGVLRCEATGQLDRLRAVRMTSWRVLDPWIVCWSLAPERAGVAG